MPSSEERMMILRMVEEGKISPEEGARLLGALGEKEATGPAPAEQPAAAMNSRQFRVRVSNVATGKQKVTVNLPLSLVNFGLRFIPPSADFDVQALRDAFNSGFTGRFVDVVDEEKGDHVEIFIE